jgi:hypothetical protein
MNLIRRVPLNFEFGMIFTFMLLTTFNSCMDRDHSKASKQNTVKKPGSSLSDTLIIEEKAAVFYSPDSLQLEKIKSVNEKMIFESMQHDCYYEMRNARLVLKKYWPQIGVIESSRTRYFLFRKADKSEQIIDLNTIGDMCGLFLFETNKNPELADMANIDTELGFYFAR